MVERRFKVKALGEVAIRCSDMERMVAFYRDIIGLEVLPGGHRDDITFFKIAEGFGGHTCVLALFLHEAENRELLDTAQDMPVTGSRSSMHHLALSLPFDEQQSVMEWYDANGQQYHVETFPWIGWRGIFTRDPEGNTVELVSHDTSLLTKNSV